MKDKEVTVIDPSTFSSFEEENREQQKDEWTIGEPLLEENKSRFVLFPIKACTVGNDDNFVAP